MFKLIQSRFARLRIVKEQGFTAVCIEADWPDAMRLNRYVKGEQQGKDKDASEALDSFKRFPQVRLIGLQLIRSS